ncbi:MAG: DUF6145 family protein [Defluviitaleaceae bacterium]|nr:DUF6145 family protein [Defluviitaleaceae bacterium]
MDDNKTVLAAASVYKAKYYINPDFASLPPAVKNDIKALCIGTAQRLHCVFMVGFYDDGSVFFEAQAQEDDFVYDEIGAPPEVKRLTAEHKELIAALQLYLKVFAGVGGEEWAGS